MTHADPTVDQQEMAHFSAIAAEWWDPEGKFKPLHALNPCRLDYVTQQVAIQFARDLRQPAPFSGLRMLDIGCGGGLLCEPMARLGAQVVGVDPVPDNIGIARLHARRSGLAIDYRAGTAGDLVAAGRFDVVLNMEVVEHVADRAAFLRECAALIAPGGLHICSTINRTPHSFALAIIGAEYILRWLPRGTHRWDRFITPDELYSLLGDAGLEPVDRKGFVFNPLTREWAISAHNLAVNYVVSSTAPQRETPA